MKLCCWAVSEAMAQAVCTSMAREFLRTWRKLWRTMRLELSWVRRRGGGSLFSNSLSLSLSRTHSTGDPLAHMSLASCYTHGRGVTQSYEKAFHHHLQASKSGLRSSHNSCSSYILHQPSSLSLSLPLLPLPRTASSTLQCWWTLLCRERGGAKLQEGR